MRRGGVRPRARGNARASDALVEALRFALEAEPVRRGRPGKVSVPPGALLSPSATGQFTADLEVSVARLEECARELQVEHRDHELRIVGLERGRGR